MSTASPREPQPDLQQLLRVARYQRAIMYSIAAQLVVTVISFAAPLPQLVRAGIAIAVGLASLVFILLLARLLFRTADVIGLTVLSLVPIGSLVLPPKLAPVVSFFSLAALFVVNQRATNELRSAGFQVGLFGGNPAEVAAVIRGERPPPSPYRPPAYERAPAWSPDPNGWWLVTPPAVAALLLLFMPFRGVAVTFVVITICVVAYWVKRDSEEVGHAHPAWLFAMVLLPIALPLYTDARRDWGRSLKLPFAIVGVIAMGAAFWFHGDVLRKLVPPAKVTVSCRQRTDVPRDGYICKTEHVGGYEDARACWDLTADCDDGTKITEHACSHAVVRETREGIVPFEYSDGIESCTAITGAVVEHLQVVLPDGDALQPVTR